jgi:hypothetical protein
LQWSSVALPLLYRNIQLTCPNSYRALADLLNSPRGKVVIPWFRRAILREVPAFSWSNPESDVGRVLARLRDLEVFKIRFRSREIETETIPLGIPPPSVWEKYPSINPKV